jgi:hypothetical protein
MENFHELCTAQTSDSVKSSLYFGENPSANFTNIYSVLSYAQIDRVITFSLHVHCS